MLRFSWTWHTLTISQWNGRPWDGQPAWPKADGIHCIHLRIAAAWDWQHEGSAWYWPRPGGGKKVAGAWDSWLATVTSCKWTCSTNTRTFMFSTLQLWEPLEQIPCKSNEALPPNFLKKTSHASKACCQWHLSGISSPGRAIVFVFSQARTDFGNLANYSWYTLW